MSLNDQLRYYADRLILQYRDKPKARAMLSIMAKQILVNGLPDLVNDAFCVDTAVGKQLDVIGKYVGLPRNIGDPAAQPYFGFWDTNIVDPGSQNTNGFQDSTNPSVNSDGLFFNSETSGAINTALNDDAYRFMIKLKIVSNRMDSSLASIDQLLQDFFHGSLVVRDNLDMTLTYVIQATLPVSAGVISQYLPRPMGCSASIGFNGGVAAPYYQSKTISTASVCTTTFPYNVLPVSGGYPPYTFAWELVSESGSWPAYPSYADTPSASSTTISKYFPFGGTWDAFWRCKITDSSGFSVYSNTIQAHLVSTASPP